jgi:drug/metabolite transporter (DMT)-like permease
VQVILLYVAVVLIWGSTWAAIPFQLGVVAEEVSIAYRFGMAAIILYVYATATGKQLKLPQNTYPFIFLQGALLFCINYILVYYGAAYLTSGIVAVLFSSIVVINAIFERAFFGRRLSARGWLASAIGITGIALIFWPEMSDVSISDDSLRGGMLVIVSVVIASLGNMTAVINTNRGLPVLAVNAHAMAFAAMLSTGIAAALGREFNFLFRTDYVASLVYLSVFGSAIAFGCYLSLLRRIGASRASYSTVLYPIVALLISTFFEDYRWTGLAVIGMLLAWGGNWLILSQRNHEKIKH